MDMEVKLHPAGHDGARPLILKNPVMTASGTFGYGAEFMPYGNIARLGGIVRSGHRRKFLSFIIVSVFLCWQEEA